MKYQLILFTGTGIGNVIQALHSIEYCISAGIKCGLCLTGIPSSFKEYLNNCYPNLLIDNTDTISCDNVIHCWLYKDKIRVKFDNYLYVNHDINSVDYVSEDESFLNIVRMLYPSDIEVSRYLKNFIEQKPEVFNDDLELNEKYAIYFGSSALSPTKRWPHFENLISILGKDNIILIGGNDDINYEYSFRYPSVINKFLNKKITNRYSFWKFLNKINLLVPHAHFKFYNYPDNLFINRFSWSELVYILRRVKGFVGNDGGLSHLASAANVKKGVVIFGPSSLNKSRPYNNRIISLSNNLHCQPCYFNVAGIHMGKGYITCPFGIKCLDEIKPKKVVELIS